MALDVPPLPLPVSWPDQSYGRDRSSPSSSSPRSQTSIGSSAFSADAPSSQSSVSSSSTPWRHSTVWGETPRWCLKTSTDENNVHVEVKPSVSHCSSQNAGFVDFACPPNPRRTRRLCQNESINGDRAPLPPPQLVRQTDRKVSFVDSLVGKMEISNSAFNY